jgi:hypothetical protein
MGMLFVAVSALLSFPPAGAVSESVLRHHWASDSHLQPKFKESLTTCEQFSPRRFSLWQSPPSPLLALTIRLAHGS